MPEQINWYNVWLSITDTWLPLAGIIAALIVLAFIVHVVKKRDH